MAKIGSKMKRKKWIILIIFLIILAIIFFWGSRPRKGKIIVKKTDEVSQIKTEKQRYENEFLTFEYPDDYVKRSEGNNLWLNGKLRIAESITLLCRDFEGNIDDDSGVKMRQVKTDEYDEEMINIAGVEGLLFIKKDKSERTAFVLKNGILISFSMTANSNDEKIGEKFREMIESWEWR